MLKKLKILLAGLLISFMFVPGLALADINCSTSTSLTPQQAAQCGVSGANGSSTVNSNQTGQATDSFNNIVSSILNILTVVVGLLAVIMIILAGSRFVTSGGNQEKVASAKRALIYAIIGIIIAALAQLIAQFAVNQATTAQNSSSSSSSSSSGNGRCVPSCH